MQRLKNSILDRMIAEQLSSKEIDFLLYVSRFQDESGRVPGVHYRETSKAMGMSFQSFYDVKSDLVKKKFIESEKMTVSIMTSPFAAITFRIKQICRPDILIRTSRCFLILSFIE